MGEVILRPFVLVLGGTSLTAGRLCTPDISWPTRLLADMQAAPECAGPVVIINTGAGSQTSNFGAAQAALYGPLRPSHVLMEDFGINDCAIGPVSLPQATINFQSMVDSYLAGNEDVVIVHQTMSPASAGDVNRTNLAAYYDNGTANALANGLLTLDHYAAWPKPLPLADTVDMDGLHPTWAAFEIYSYPLILSWARQAMADYWLGSAYALLTQNSDPILTQDGLVLEVEH